MSLPMLYGIVPSEITTQRITTRVLFSGPNEAIPVLFLHGNLSSATWWEETMLALPDAYRGIAPDQRGYGDAEPDKKIDATRGMGDLADDAIALLDTLGVEQVHVVGQSLGGNVVWRLMMDYPERLRSVTLAAPGSPYGFGGTKGAEGIPCYEDFAGSGAGLINPEFLRRMMEGEQGTDNPLSPRNVLRTLILKPGFISPREDDLLASLLSTHWGQMDYPGDTVSSPNWPGKAPGVWGPNNAISPKYASDIDKLVTASHKPPVLWVRGAEDRVVSDMAASDPGTLGSLGVLPGWPGPEVYPPQPMLAQIRALLDRYAEAGGYVREVVVENCGHTPYLEHPSEFNQVFHQHITQADITRAS